MALNFEKPTGQPVWAAVLAISLVSLGVWLYRCNQRPASFPPGPKTLPVLGNLHQMPSTFPFLKFTEWAKTYGDVVGLKVGPLNMVILNSAEAVHSLFISKGSIYSGRSVTYVTENFLFPGQEQPIMFQNDTKLRRMKTAMRHVTSTSGLAEALPMQDRVSSKLISNLREKSYAPAKCISLWSFEIAVTAMMGPVGSNAGLPELLDEWTVLQHGVLDIFASVSSSLYDMVPYPELLRPIMPKAAEAKARALGAGLQKIYVDFFASLKKHLLHAEESGKDIEYLGLIGKIMEGQKQRSGRKEAASESDVDSYTEPQLRSMVQFVQDAATDTTTATALTFILALALYPELLRKAQDEVDRVCDEQSKDMPTHLDIGRLPYVKACILESLRWRSPAPMWLPHRAEQDDTVLGYHIPKDSIIMGNAWAISRDERVFQDPETFDPERFMSGKDSAPFHAFGIGRRSCPGDQFALNSLMSALPKVIRSFDLVLEGPRPDMSVDKAYLNGIVLSPKALPIRFVPRR